MKGKYFNDNLPKGTVPAYYIATLLRHSVTWAIDSSAVELRAV